MHGSPWEEEINRIDSEGGLGTGGDRRGRDQVNGESMGRDMEEV